MSFRAKQRSLLGDATPAYQYADADLDGWRDDEIGQLYANGLHKRGTNFGAEIQLTQDANMNYNYYYPLPAGFRRVWRVEAWVPPGLIGSTPLVYRGTLPLGSWDDQERPGFLRVFDYELEISWLLRLFGEQEYTDITDVALLPEVGDVVLYGTAIRSTTSALAARIQSSRSLAITSPNDASPGALSATMNVFRREYERRLKVARELQARTVWTR